MREQITLHINKYLRQIIQNEIVDSITIKQGHRDITLKLIEEYTPESLETEISISIKK